MAEFAPAQVCLESVHFPPETVEGIAWAYQNIPNGKFKGSTSIVKVGKLLYSLPITPLQAGTIGELYALWQNSLIGEADFSSAELQLPIEYDGHQDILLLEQDDLGALFYVMDKIISGADPVSLDGELKILKEVLTEVLKET